MAWLSSGAGSALPPSIPTIDPIALVDNGTVGAAFSNSEHVLVGKLPIVVTKVPGGTAGASVTVVKYAYWVGDEGMKISAYSPGASLTPVLASSPTSPALAKLQTALTTYSSKLGAVISFEQSSLLLRPADALTASVLNDSFHHTTLTSTRRIFARS